MKIHKIRFTIFLILVLITLFGLYKGYQVLRIRFAKIEVEIVDDLEVSFYSDVKLSTFIKKINGTFQDRKINTEKLGKKEITFSYINNDKIPVSYSFTIDVLDKDSPKFLVGDLYSVPVKSTHFLENIRCIDNYDPDPLVKIEGEYDVFTTGDYSVTLVAEDMNGNITKKPITLRFYEPGESEARVDSTKSTISYDTMYQKYKTKDTLVGIDVSKWQGDIDYSKLKNVDFVMIRIGYTSKSNGHFVLDPKFERNYTEAKKHGILVGVYYYSRAFSVKDAVKEAKWVIKTLNKRQLDLPIAFDWEIFEDFHQNNLSMYTLTKMALSFTAYVEKNQYEGMIYGSKYYLERYYLPHPKKIWLAQYVDQATYPKFAMWQFSDIGRINGIDGNVDMNVLYKGEMLHE